MSHALPGFVNYKVIADVTFSAGALPYNQYFSYDKALIGLALIAFGVPVCRERSGWGYAQGNHTLELAGLCHGRLLGRVDWLYPARS